MEIEDYHGVIVVYHGKGKTGPCEIHLPDGCEVVLEAVDSKTWERYPSLRVAMELGFAPCVFCFKRLNPDCP